MPTLQVTLETLRTRMGVAAAIQSSLTRPSDKVSIKDAMRARKFTDMHEPILKKPGPFEDSL